MLAVADVLVCYSQRSLAEIVEIIHTGVLIHKGIVNISSVADQSSSALTNLQIGDLEFGKKMAVLSGDFLLAKAFTGLAELNNTQVGYIHTKRVTLVMVKYIRKLLATMLHIHFDHMFTVCYCQFNYVIHSG